MAAALVLLAAWGLSQAARAAEGTRVAQHVQAHITVAPTIPAEAASEVSLVIEVGPADALPPNAFVRLRGLPATASLTAGHVIAAGAWAVPLFGLTALKITIPVGVAGRSDIVISLVSIDGVQLAEAQTALVVNPPAPMSGAITATAAPLPVPAARLQRGSPPAVSALSAQARARAEHLLAQGERYLEQGNITPARQFFRQAAEAGLAQGAMRLADTYAPAELRRMRAQGVVADAAEARHWYERAKELGAPAREADERLARLGPPGS